MSLGFRTLVLLTGLLTAGFVGAPRASAQAVITNGTVTLGVNAHGHLNVPGPASPIVGTPIVGVRDNATGWEALAHHSPCEGWGAAIANVGISGWANQCFAEPGDGGPVFNLRADPFSFTADRATSSVFVGNPFDPGHDLLQVTHAWAPSAWPTLYQGSVTIRNVNGGFLGDAGATIGDIRYRRVLDWDVEATVSEDLVTIGGIDGPWPHTPASLLFSGDNGFETADPLRFEAGAPVDVFAAVQQQSGVSNPTPCGFTRNFTTCGRFLAPGGTPVVVDHGAMFDFAFPALAPGAAHEFAVFYGAAPSREDAELALYMVGAEVYSLANCRPLEPGFGGAAGCDPETGAPVTFIFAAAGVGGAPVFGDISGAVYQDLNGNGAFDVGSDAPLAGVTLMLVGTDLVGQAITRTTTTADDGSYVFAAVPRGTYSVSAPTSSAGLVRSTTNPLGATVGGTFPYVMTVDFGYVAVAALQGTVYTDTNGDGAFTSGTDGPLAGVTLTINGSRGSLTALTGSDGRYSTSGLLPGTYTISAPAAIGGQALATASPLTLTLAAGQQGAASFAYRTPVPSTTTTSISGTAYTDVDRSRGFSPGVDTPLADVTITLYGPAGILTTTTGTDGTYRFTDLVPGRYRVTAPPQVNYGGLTTERSVSLRLVTGDARAVDFGYRQPPLGEVHGVVFNDVKRNREWNREKDAPAGGVLVTLVTPGGVLTTTTLADGTYAFDRLPPGLYMVSVPTTLDGQPLATRNPVSVLLHGGERKVNFGYLPPPVRDCNGAGVLGDHADSKHCKDKDRR